MIDYRVELDKINAEFAKDKSRYPLHNYSDLADALKLIRKQYLAGEPLVWTGPTDLHHSVSATSPGPDWQFSPEGLAYHAERDRDFWDVYTQVSFHLGFHQGAVNESERTAFYKKLHSIAMLREDRQTDDQ